MHILKRVSTPSAAPTALSLTNGELLADPTKYRSMVGALQYLAITHPNITYAIHVVSQFKHGQHTIHLYLHAVKRVFRYLQGTLDDGLFFAHLSPLPPSLPALILIGLTVRIPIVLPLDI